MIGVSANTIPEENSGLPSECDNDPENTALIIRHQTDYRFSKKMDKKKKSNISYSFIYFSSLGFLIFYNLIFVQRKTQHIFKWLSDFLFFFNFHFNSQIVDFTCLRTRRNHRR